MLEPDFEFYGGSLMLSLFILIYGLSSNLIKEKLFLSEALVSTATGIVVSCTGLDWLDISSLDARGQNRLFYHLARYFG